MVEGPFADAEEGDAVYVLHVHFGGHEAEEVGDEEEVGEVFLAVEHDFDEVFLGECGGAGEGDDVYGVFFEEGGEVFEGVLEEFGGEFGGGGFAGEGEAGDDAAAAAGFAFEFVAELDGDGAGAEEDDAAFGGLIFGPVPFALEEDVSFEDDEEGDADHGDAGGESGEGGVYLDDEGEDHGEEDAEAAGADDAGDFVYEVAVLGAFIEAEGAEDEEDEDGDDDGGVEVHAAGGVAAGDFEPAGVEADPDGEEEAAEDRECIG